MELLLCVIGAVTVSLLIMLPRLFLTRGVDYEIAEGGLKVLRFNRLRLFIYFNDIEGVDAMPAFTSDLSGFRHMFSIKDYSSSYFAPLCRGYVIVRMRNANMVYLLTPSDPESFVREMKCRCLISVS